jgi:hypothetical protein
MKVDYRIERDIGTIVGVAVPFSSRNGMKQNRTEQKSRQRESHVGGDEKGHAIEVNMIFPSPVANHNLWGKTLSPLSVCGSCVF